MAVFAAILMSVFYLNFISGYVIVGDDDNEIVWPSEYYFTGERLNLLTTVKQNFELWYSTDLNRSRIDFNSGTVKKYFYGDEKKMYTLYPMIDSSDLTSEIVCSVKKRKAEHPDFMPDLEDLSFSDKIEYLFDKVVDVWYGSTECEGNKIEEITVYVYKTDYGIDIPVQKIIKKYNMEIGELFFHEITNYYNYKDSVTEDDLTVEDESECFYDGELGKDFKTDIKILHPDLPNDLDIAFDSYTNYHNKEYREKEKELRKRIFEENWRMVREHNSKNLGFKLEMNEFSDKTPEELKYLRGTFVSDHQMPGVQSFPHTLTEIDDLMQDLPQDFDLRMEGVVNAVKNQAKCGSCWAFATTAAVEGALARVNGDRLLDLSEQSLVDCAWSYENLGCEGGTLNGAMKYVYENGIPSEMKYGPYLEQNGVCKLRNMTESHNIRGFALVTPRNPNALKVALYKYGPVTAAIHASKLMSQYASGVFYDFSCDEDASPNHAVTVVGYGVRDGEDYWLVKNSWGEIWGEDGYILMSAKDNNCFLLDTPYYPIV